jgi:peptidoglycan-N-acetylglucosamine deacetylase
MLSLKSILPAFILAAALAVSTQCARFDRPGPVATGIQPVSKQTFSGKQRQYRKVSIPDKIIAMTFDDGPHSSNTPRLLDILKARGVKATFYVVGDRCKGYANIVRRIVAEGHELGNHTWTHPLQPNRWSREKLEPEIRMTHETLISLTGAAPKTYRPPGGAVTPDQIDWLLADFGYPTIIWAVDPKDFKVLNANIVQRHILADTDAGEIVLSHDLYRTTVDAMPGTLDGLLAKGFRFATVSQLLALAEGKPAETTVKEIHFSMSPGGM